MLLPRLRRARRKQGSDDVRGAVVWLGAAGFKSLELLYSKLSVTSASIFDKRSSGRFSNLKYGGEPLRRGLAGRQ